MRTIVWIVLPFLFAGSVYGQEPEAPTEKRFKMGFGAGLNYSMANYSAESLSGSAANGLGVRVGVLGEYRLAPMWYVSPRAELSFHNTEIGFGSPEDGGGKYEVMPVSTDIATYVIFKSRPEHSSRPYALLGPSIQIPLPDRNAPSDFFATGPNLSLDLGIGCDVSTKHFDFAPELRYSFGLLDVNQNPAFQSVYFHNISFVINFKG